MGKLKLISILLLIFILCSVDAQRSRALYGEMCDRDIRCDGRASLACFNGLCQCSKEGEMVYDEKRGKCLVLAGERCSNPVVSRPNDGLDTNWAVKMQCVENAFCSEEGYCTCAPKFFESSTGLCLQKQTYGGNCSRHSECNQEKTLVCADGRCGCNSTEAVFDVKSRLCLGKVGSSCAIYSRCIHNANCARRREAGPGWKMDMELCACKEGYQRGSDRLCYGKHDFKCDPVTSPCARDLACVNERCECPFPEHQVYDRELKKCMSGIKGPCSEWIAGRKITFPCPRNAECRIDNGVAECLCIPGFIDSFNGRCEPTFGSPCRTFAECDSAANLVCKNGTCACRGLKEYDKEREMCVGLVGAKCDVLDKEFCTEGAFCQPCRASKTRGTCRCGPDFHVDSLTRLCLRGPPDTSVLATADDDHDHLPEEDVGHPRIAGDNRRSHSSIDNGLIMRDRPAARREKTRPRGTVDSFERSDNPITNGISSEERIPRGRVYNRDYPNQRARTRPNDLEDARPIDRSNQNLRPGRIDQERTRGRPRDDDTEPVIRSDIRRPEDRLNEGRPNDDRPIRRNKGIRDDHRNSLENDYNGKTDPINRRNERMRDKKVFDRNDLTDGRRKDRAEEGRPTSRNKDGMEDVRPINNLNDDSKDNGRPMRNKMNVNDKIDNRGDGRISDNRPINRGDGRINDGRPINRGEDRINDGRPINRGDDRVDNGRPVNRDDGRPMKNKMNDNDRINNGRSNNHDDGRVGEGRPINRDDGRPNHRNNDLTDDGRPVKQGLVNNGGSPGNRPSNRDTTGRDRPINNGGNDNNGASINNGLRKDKLTDGPATSSKESLGPVAGERQPDSVSSEAITPSIVDPDADADKTEKDGKKATSLKKIFQEF